MLFVPGQWHIDHGPGLSFEYVPGHFYNNMYLYIIWIAYFEEIGDLLANRIVNSAS